MALEEVINASEVILPEVILEVGRVALWLQTLGIIIVLWIIFQSVTLFYNRKRRLAIYSIKDDLERIENRVKRIEKSLTKKK